MEHYSGRTSTDGLQRVEAPPAGRPVPAQRRKGEARPVPVVREEYAHLSVEALRDYRAALNDEEDKVSYWRRLLQGRLDVVAGRAGGSGDQQARLGTMLAQERVAAGRQALATVVPGNDVPPLPLLSELWNRQLAPGDDAARERLLADLQDAEAQLSAYRTSLHARLAEATGELIARYRAEPTLCLSVLPQVRTSTGA